jgi:hypothetical protein
MASNFHFRDLGASDDELYLPSDSIMSETSSFDTDGGYKAGKLRTTGRKAPLPKGHRQASTSKSKGKQAKSHDLFARYPSGISVEKIIEELQAFLVSSEEQ